MTKNNENAEFAENAKNAKNAENAENAKQQNLTKNGGVRMANEGLERTFP